MTLPCFACGRVLESVLGPDHEANQPYAGTTFYSPGQYGSTVWDPQTSRLELELNLCDPCLLAGHERVSRVVTQVKQVRYPEPWTPVNENESDG